MNRAVIAALAVISAAISVGAKAGDGTRRYAVIIGNNYGYQAETPLHYAERDASRLADVLQKLGDVKAGDTTLVLGREANEVRAALLEVNASIRRDGSPSSALIVYYSGHADAEGLHLGPTNLDYDEVRNVVTGSPATVRVLVLDACRSGGLTRIKGARNADAFDVKIDDRLRVEGLALITSSTAGEDSHESDRLRGSFFSHHFQNALLGAADHNQDGRITLNEAYAYAYGETLRSSGQTLSLQHPTYSYDIKGKGELVVTTLAAAREAAVLSIHEPGSYVVQREDVAAGDVAEVQANKSGVRFSLVAGRYLVRLRTPSYFKEYHLTLERGAKVDLQDQPFERIAYARLARKGGVSSFGVHGVWASATAHGGIVDGFDVHAGPTVGYTLDMEWLSVGGHFRYARADSVSDRSFGSSLDTYSVGLTAHKLLDFEWLSVGLGMMLELVVHAQAFTTAGIAQARTGVGAAFGGYAIVERELIAGSYLRVQGGPSTHITQRGVTDGGEQVGSTLHTPLLWRTSLGFGWRF